MNKIALILILSLFLGSCATQRRCNLKFPPTSTRDSIYIEKIKNVPVFVPGDTINVEVPINCPDQNLVDINTSKLEQQIKILNGKLVSKTNIKPDTIFVPVKETQTIVKEVKVPAPIEVIPQRFKTYRNIVFFLFALAFAFIGYKAYTFFKPKA